MVEAGVTLLIALFGVIVIIGSVKAGINWGAEGPRAGFFPFYIGIFIVVSSAINLWNGLREDNDEPVRRMGTASPGHERRHSDRDLCRRRCRSPGSMSPRSSSSDGSCDGSANIRWITVLAVAIGMPVVTYFIFERWFLVPLPKGPVEEWLGL